MALTATATWNTFDVIVKQLSLKDPVVVAILPNRANIKLSVKPSQSLEEFAAEISEGCCLLFSWICSAKLLKKFTKRSDETANIFVAILLNMIGEDIVQSLK